jgi:phospholipid/cholesterol/gamma-HCH transport system substrate-binding protein
MSRRRDNLAVGVFAVAAILALFAAGIWLARGGFSTGYPLYTHFAWGQNLKTGQAVRLAGVSIGYVDEVTLAEGKLDVKLSITEKKFRVPKGSTATVQPVGIFGDVEVALAPPMPLPTESYQAGDTIPPGVSPIGMSAILARVDTIGVSVQKLTTALHTQFVEAGGLRDMQRALARLVTLQIEIQRVATNQDRNLTLTMETLRTSANRMTMLADSTSHRMLSLIDSAAVDSTMKGIRASSENLSKMTATLDSTARVLNSIMGKIDRGEGSLGKVLNDPTLALQVQGLVSQLDSLVVDFKRNPQRYVSFSIFGRNKD